MKKFANVSIWFYVFFLFSIHVQARELTSSGKQSKSLLFIENKGQILDQNNEPRDDIDFKLSVDGLTIFLGDGQLHYQWVKSDERKASSVKKTSISNTPSYVNDSMITSFYRMDVVLVNANNKAVPIVEEKDAYVEHHYLPYDEDGVVVNSYKKITYPNIYPNIDWVLYTDGKHLKYDFIVHSGGHIKDIHLKYEGATSLILKEGQLVATTPYGSITEQKPYTYVATTREELKSKYTLAGNILSFDIAPNETKADIVIDPSIVWATYYGGDKNEYGGASAIDTSGNVYITGETTSTNLATTGAHQTVAPNTWDVFIVKFSPIGQRIWATYYGGSYGCRIYSICSDHKDGIYITGSTITKGLATVGAFKDTITNIALVSRGETILAKFNTNGVREWATYYGISGRGLGVTTDYDNNVCIVGDCASSLLTYSQTYAHYYATTGAFQDTFSFTNSFLPHNGYLAKFSTTGARLWSTIYPTMPHFIACDSSNNIYIGSHVDSTIAAIFNLTTTGAHQTTHGGAIDAHISKFSSSGARQWATLYGGASYDRVTYLGADKYDNLYVCGMTMSTMNIATIGTHKSTKIGIHPDGFIVKFNSAGVRQWGSYFGGNGGDGMYSIKVGQDNKVYAVGVTFSSSNIATAGAYQTSLLGLNDCFLNIFSPKGQLDYGTYFGGSHIEAHVSGTFYAGHLLLDKPDMQLYKNSSMFLSGRTASDSFLATPGAYKTSMGGSNWDIFLAKFNIDTAVYLVHPFTDTFLCMGDSLQVPYYVNYTHNVNNTFTVQLSDTSGSFATPTVIGTSTSNTSGVISCYIPTTLTPTRGYRIRIVGSAPNNSSEDNSIDIRIEAPPSNFITSTITPICVGDTMFLNASSSSSNATFKWTGPNGFSSSSADTIRTNVKLIDSGQYKIVINHKGCVLSNAFDIVINPSPVKPVASSNSTVCGGDTLKLYATTPTSAATFTWLGPLGFTSNQQTPTKANVQPIHSGTYIVSAELGTCIKKDTVLVTVDTAAIINIFPSPSNIICEGTPVTLVAIAKHTGSNPNFQWTKNGSTISSANKTTYTATGIQDKDEYGVILTPSTACSSSAVSNTIKMDVAPIVKPYVSIIATPSLPVSPWTLVTFTATQNNGGAIPMYQWVLNGSNIFGATSDSWGTYQVNDGDTIFVKMQSSERCTIPKDTFSNKVVVKMLLDVGTLTKEDKVSLLPNPNNGSFFLIGDVSIKEKLSIEIVNSIGRVVYRQDVRQGNTSLYEEIIVKHLPDGVYFLRLNSKSEQKYYKFIIEK